MSLLIERLILETKSLEKLEPVKLASVLAYLISIESKPGGPYLPKHSDEKKFNEHLITLLNTTKKNSVNIQKSLADKSLHNEIKLELEKININNRDILNSIHNKIIQADIKGEISRINRTFFRSMKSKSSESASNIKLRLMDKANVYVWMAYTLYDDVIDDNNTALVPYANILMREALRFYLMAGVDIDFLYKEFDQVDTANEMELELRKAIKFSNLNQSLIESDQILNDFEILLYKKSILHCAGLKWQVRKCEQKTLLKIYTSFNLYCGSRQLNDDIHDWKEDFKNNQPTYTVYRLLKRSLLDNTTYEGNLVSKMQSIFWHEELNNQCSKIKDDIKQAIDILRELIDVDSNFIKNFLDPIYNSADTAIKTHEYDVSFVSEYKKISSFQK